MRSSKKYRSHIITTTVKILFLAMLSAQLRAGRVYAEERASTDQMTGIEAELITEDTELAEEPALSKERSAADDTIPAADDAAPAANDVEPAADDAAPAAEDDAAPAAGDDSEPGTEDDAEPVADDVEPGAEEDAAPGAEDDAEPVVIDDAIPGAENDAEPAAGDDAEPAAGDDAEPTADDAEPATDDADPKAAGADPEAVREALGATEEDPSQPSGNPADSQEAPEFSCLDDLLPHNGIPLVIVRINEDDGNATIDEMNGSKDHSVKCAGTVEIRFPEGYSVGGVYFGTTTGEMALEYVRGRGNSTWGAPKKPYKIKFDSKQDLLDMGKSKEWALMANSMDPTVMKNRITYALGEMMGLGETPQLVPVEVVMIGSQKDAEYLGLYDLSETIKFEKSRLDLKTPDADATQEEGDGNITGAYLLSIYDVFQDTNDPSSNHFVTDSVTGLLGFMFNEPEFESEDLTEAQRAQRDYMQTYIRDLEALIMTDDYIDEDQHRLIADKMDLTSTADYWWVQIFSKNTDAYFTSSTHLYKPADDKLYWGPLWDFDLGWSFKVDSEEPDPKDAAGYWLVGFPWIDHLRKSDPYFVKLLKDRWGEMQPKLGELTADDGLIDRFKTEIAQAQTDDYRKWSYAAAGNEDYSGVSDYDAVIEKLKQLIGARIAWFNENLETVGSFLTVRMDAAGGTGVMADIITVKKDGEFELPACEFAPESGSEFVGWKIGDELYKEGDVVTLSKDTVLMAVWKVIAPEDEPVELEIPDLPVPDKPVPVAFVLYENKSEQKTADAGRSGERNARAAGGNGKYRSPDSGDGAEPILWVVIMAAAGMAACGVKRGGRKARDRKARAGGRGGKVAI